MALGKIVETPNGTQATYWCVMQGAFDRLAAKLVAHVYGYASEQARREGKQPLMVKRVEFPLDPTSPIFAQWDALLAAKNIAMTNGFQNGTEDVHTMETRQVADMAGGEVFYRTEQFETITTQPFVDRFFDGATEA